MIKVKVNLSVCVVQPFRVRGCVLTLVERMDEEFTKIMQNTDPHSQGTETLTSSVVYKNH